MSFIDGIKIIYLFIYLFIYLLKKINLVKKATVKKSIIFQRKGKHGLVTDRGRPFVWFCCGFNLHVIGEYTTDMSKSNQSVHIRIFSISSGVK